MSSKSFHDKPYDAGTLAKLRIFELYAREWIPVFLARPEPKFQEVHIFDFFCGPGKDSVGTYGSPLRILKQVMLYHHKGLASWYKVPITIHLFDKERGKIDELDAILKADDWKIPGVTIVSRQLTFREALDTHQHVLENPRLAKLLIIDQYGVDEVTDDIFKRLIGYPTTDFIFFLSSSTLHRFRDHPAIKQKIGGLTDSYYVHRAVLEYYRNLVPAGDKVFLGPFSIRKRSNIYGLVFGSRHPLGIHKFLQVAWASDELAGEANFDIERENIVPGQGILALDVMRPNKLRVFEEALEAALRSGKMNSELDVVRFCIEEGMTSQHSTPVLKKLKDEGVIETDFKVPNVSRIKTPRSIRMR